MLNWTFCGKKQQIFVVNTALHCTALLGKGVDLFLTTLPKILFSPASCSYFFYMTNLSFFCKEFWHRLWAGVCSSLTCHPRCGFVGGGFGVWLSPGLGRRRLSVRGAKLRLREPLHHGAVLAVTVPAAALLLAAVLGHHIVVAAVVTEDASAEPKKKNSVMV